MTWVSRQLIDCRSCDVGLSRQLIGCRSCDVGLSRQLIGCRSCDVGLSRQMIGYRSCDVGLPRQMIGYRSCDVGLSRQLIGCRSCGVGLSRQLIGCRSCDVGLSRQMIGYRSCDVGRPELVSELTSFCEGRGRPQLADQLSTDVHTLELIIRALSEPRSVGTDTAMCCQTATRTSSTLHKCLLRVQVQVHLFTLNPLSYGFSLKEITHL